MCLLLPVHLKWEWDHLNRIYGDLFNIKTLKQLNKSIFDYFLNCNTLHKGDVHEAT